MTVMFPPRNSIGLGNLEPQRKTGSPPSEDLIDTHSFRHRTENWEKLQREETSPFRSDSTISIVLILKHIEFRFAYLRTMGSPSKPLMIQQS